MTWGIAVLATLLAAVGVGVPATPPYAPIARARLEVRAASSCTHPRDLIARVVARTPRIQFADDSAAIGVQATFVQLRSGGVSAELVLVEAGANRAPRRFATRSCAEAADAVALMIAVALDPVWVKEHPAAGAVAGETRLDVPSGPTPGTSAAVPGTSKSAGEPAAKATETAPKRPPREPSRPERAPADATSSPTPRMRPRVGAYLAGHALWGPAPALMPGVAAYVLGALDRTGLWSPAIVIGAMHAWRSDLAEPGGHASFSLDAGSLDACALRVRVSIVDARACASVLIGRLSASGSDTDQPATVANLFAAAGASGTFTVDLGSTAQVLVRIGTGFTLRRDSYEFASTVFHSVSRFTTSASLGLGLRLY